jgi:DNA polymerase III subunit beta
MEIRLNRAELVAELAAMQGIVERRTTFPALSHVLLKAEGDRVELSATDLDVSLTSFCAGTVHAPGAIAVQAKKLHEIMRTAIGDETTLRVDRDGELTILAGPSMWRIRALPADDFPNLPTVEGEPLLLPFPTFRAMIAKVFFAISSEESRFQLLGALLRCAPESLTLVATDGHRLALVESRIDGKGDPENVLVPRKALQELQRFDGEDLALYRSEHHLAFTIGRRQLICRILEGTFPDYERVIAKNHDKIVPVDRRQLVGVIQRVSLVAGDRARAIKVELDDGRLIFSATNPDLGEAREEVSCDYRGNGMSIGLNPDYLIQFLSAMETEKVRLELKDSDSQCLAQPIDGVDVRYLCVIMPVRI